MSIKTGLSSTRLSWAQVGNRMVAANGVDSNFVIHSDLSTTPHGITSPNGPCSAVQELPVAGTVTYTLTVQGDTAISSRTGTSTAVTGCCSTAGLTADVWSSAASTAKLFLNQNYKGNMALLRMDIPAALAAVSSELGLGVDEFADNISAATLSLYYDKSTSGALSRLPSIINAYAPLSAEGRSMAVNDMNRWEYGDCSWYYRENVGTPSSAVAWDAIDPETRPIIGQPAHPGIVPLWGREPGEQLHAAHSYEMSSPIATATQDAVTGNSAANLPTTLDFSGNGLVSHVIASLKEEIPLNILFHKPIGEGDRSVLEFIGASGSAASRPKIVLTYNSVAVTTPTEGNLDGTYYYAYTYYDAPRAQESNPSPLMAEGIVVHNNKVTISGFSFPSTDGQERSTHIRLYRNLNGGVIWYRVAEIAIPKTAGVIDQAADGTIDVSYEDNMSDDDLATQTTISHRNDKPPSAKHLCAVKNRVHGLSVESDEFTLSGTVGTGDYTICQLGTTEYYSSAEVNNQNGRAIATVNTGTVTTNLVGLPAVIVKVNSPTDIEAYDGFTVASVDAGSGILYFDRRFPAVSGTYQVFLYAKIFTSGLVGRQCVISTNGVVRTISHLDELYPFRNAYVTPKLAIDETGTGTIRILGDDSKTWWTEANAPESWHYSNEWQIGVDDGDTFVGGHTFKGGHIIFKKRHIYGHLYTLDPNPLTGDGEIRTFSAERGAANERCITEVNSNLIVLDRYGVYQFDGFDVKHISRPVDDIFRAADWTKEAQFWIEHHRAGTKRQVRFFIVSTGDTVPQTCVVWDYARNEWWTEAYQHGMTCGTDYRDTGGNEITLVGDNVKYLWALDHGRVDGVDTAGAVNGVVTGYSSTFGMAASASTFPLTGQALNGAWVYYQAQDGDWQWFRVATTYEHSLKPPAPLTGADVPLTGGAFRIGAIPMTWASKTAALGVPGLHKQLKEMFLTFIPQTATTAVLRVYLDHSSTPFEDWGQAYNEVNVSWTADGGDITLDLSKSDGVIRIPPPTVPFRFIKFQIVDNGGNPGRVQILGIDLVFEAHDVRWS